jgi:hypothetical protein
MICVCSTTGRAGMLEEAAACASLADRQAPAHEIGHRNTAPTSEALLECAAERSDCNPSADAQQLTCDAL